MKVRIINSSGYSDRHGKYHSAGSVADFPDDIAAKLLIHRIAERVPEPKIETAELAPAENMARTHKPQGRPAKAFSPTRKANK